MVHFLAESGVLTGYTGNRARVTVPAQVTAIGERAFAGNKYLTHVIVPEGVTSIGAFAFSNCPSLVSVHLPDSLTELGTGAFQDCRSLRDLVLPPRLRELPCYLLRGCVSLTGLTIPPAVMQLRDYALDCCDALTDLTLTAGDMDLEPRSLHGAYNLCSLTVLGNDHRVLTRFMKRLAPCLSPRAEGVVLHLRDLTALPAAIDPVWAFRGWLADGLDLSYPGYEAYVRARLRQLIPLAIAQPALLQMMCSSRLLPPGMLPIVERLAGDAGSIQAAAILLAHRNSPAVGASVRRAEARTRRQAGQIAQRALDRRGTLGIAGMVFAAAGSRYLWTPFRDRAALADFLAGHGAVLARGLSGHANCLVRLPETDADDRITLLQAEQLGVPVVTPEELVDMAEAQ